MTKQRLYTFACASGSTNWFDVAALGVSAKYVQFLSRRRIALHTFFHFNSTVHTLTSPVLLHGLHGSCLRVFFCFSEVREKS